MIRGGRVTYLFLEGLIEQGMENLVTTGVWLWSSWMPSLKSNHYVTEIEGGKMASERIHVSDGIWPYIDWLHDLPPS